MPPRAAGGIIAALKFEREQDLELLAEKQSLDPADPEVSRNEQLKQKNF